MDQATHIMIGAFILGNTDDVLHGRKSRGNHSPLRTPMNIGADLLAIEKREMLDSLLVGGTPT